MGENRVGKDGLIPAEKLGFWSFLKKIFFRKKNSRLNDAISIEELQKKYENGEILESEMTKKQVDALAAIYDRKILDLKTSNELLKEKIMRYRESMWALKRLDRSFANSIKREDVALLELQQKYENGEILESEMAPEQVEALSKLYDEKIAELKGTVKRLEDKVMKYKKKLAI